MYFVLASKRRSAVFGTLRPDRVFYKLRIYLGRYFHKALSERTQTQFAKQFGPSKGETDQTLQLVTI